MPLVTQADYARHLAVTKQAVSKMVKSGRIPVFSRDGSATSHDGPGEKLIDPVRADAALKTSARRFSYSATPSLPPEPEPAPADLLSLPPASVAPTSPTAVAARAHREHLQARLLEIDLATKQGALLGRDAALAAFEEGGRLIRRKMEALPALAPELAAIALTDGENGVRKMLKEEMNKLVALIARAMTLRADEVTSGDLPEDE